MKVSENLEPEPMRENEAITSLESSVAVFVDSTQSRSGGSPEEMQRERLRAAQASRTGILHPQLLRSP